MFCRFCGSQLNNDAVFCDKCGKRLKTVVVASSVNTNMQVRLANEIKSSKLLFILPHICLLWWIMYVPLLKYIYIAVNYSHVSIYYEEAATIIFRVIEGIFFGALAFTSVRRTAKFTLIFMIPYLIYSVGYPFFYNYMYIFEEGFYIFDYFGYIILPFVVFGILSLLKNDIKSKVLLEVISTVIAIVVFSLYSITYNFLVYRTYNMAVDFTTVLSLGLVYVPVSIGAVISSVLLHVVYIKKK